MSKQMTRDLMIEDLVRLGLRTGDVVLVHSSLSKIGWVDDGADAVIDALLSVVGGEGTVMVPTLTGSADLSAENPPVFDVRSTPCWTGKIPETFRSRDNAVRSLHPTHSIAAIGAMAEEIAAGHENAATPCGKGSPYDRLSTLSNGRILLLGVTLESCTSFHHVEELAEVPYHMQEFPAEATVVDREGQERRVMTYLHKYGYWRNFEGMKDRLIQAGIMRTGKIGDADSALISAKEFTVSVLNAVKENPEILLLKSS